MPDIDDIWDDEEDRQGHVQGEVHSRPAMSNKTELLPCPFCGSNRITVWNIRDGQQAVCKDCHAEGAPAFNGPGGPDKTHAAAVAAWNRRSAVQEANPAAPTGAEGVAAALEREAARLKDEARGIHNSSMRDATEREAAAFFRAAGIARAATPAPAPEAQPPNEWQDISTAPRVDGLIDVRSVTTYRWKPYRYGSRELRNGILGRWQRATDFGWENANLPESGDWRPNPPSSSAGEA